MTTPVVQAEIVLQRMGNALADQAVAVDGAGKIFTAVLAYDLQDNRIGWCEVFVQNAPGPLPDEPILRIETNVPRGMLKPDSVDMAPVGNNLHVRQSVHATWLGAGPEGRDITDMEFSDMLEGVEYEGEGVQEIQPRLIALSEHVLVGVWTPLQAPAPAPAPAPYPKPCVPPGNRPYFDPNKLVTRAQTAKIVAIALGLPAPLAGQQTFEDIPEGSTFWKWIEALAATGAINGYPCE